MEQTKLEKIFDELDWEDKTRTPSRFHSSDRITILYTLREADLNQFHLVRKMKEIRDRGGIRFWRRSAHLYRDDTGEQILEIFETEHDC